MISLTQAFLETVKDDRHKINRLKADLDEMLKNLDEL